MAEKGEETLYDSKETMEWRNYTFKLLFFSISLGIFCLGIFFLLLLNSLPDISIFEMGDIILFLFAVISLGIIMPYKIKNRKSIKISKKFIYISNTKNSIPISIKQIKSIYYFKKREAFIIIIDNGNIKTFTKDIFGNPYKIISILKKELNIDVITNNASIPIGLISNEESLYMELKEFEEYRKGINKPPLIKRFIYNS